MATRHRAVPRTDKQNFLCAQIRAPRDPTRHVQQNRIQSKRRRFVPADRVDRIGIQGRARQCRPRGDASNFIGASQCRDMQRRVSEQ